MPSVAYVAGKFIILEIVPGILFVQVGHRVFGHVVALSLILIWELKRGLSGGRGKGPGFRCFGMTAQHGVLRPLE